MKESNSSRDATSLKILGTFFVILGLLVLVGIFWTLGDRRAIVVNAASGLTLLAVGGVMHRVAASLKAPTVAVDVSDQNET